MHPACESLPLFTLMRQLMAEVSILAWVQKVVPDLPALSTQYILLIQISLDKICGRVFFRVFF